MGASNPERDGANLLGANAGKELYGRCLDCKTARRFAIAPLAGQFGPPTHIAHLSRRLKCRECGRRLLQFNSGTSNNTAWKPRHKFVIV